MPSLPSLKVFHKYKKAGNAIAFPAQKFKSHRRQAAKSVADFYPQGVCGIRKAAKLLTAAQAAAHGPKASQTFASADAK